VVRRPGKVLAVDPVVSGLVVADGGAVLLAVVAADMPDAGLLLLLMLTIGAWVHGGLYRTRFTLSVLDEVPRLASGLLMGTGATLLLVLGTGLAEEGSAAALVRSACVFGVSAVLLRTVVYAFTRHLRRRGRLVRRAVIVSTDTEGVRLAEIFGRHPEFGVHVAGFVDDHQGREGHLPAPLLDSLDRLPDLIQRRAASVVLVAAGQQEDPELVRTLRACSLLGCEIYLEPRLSQLHVSGRDDDPVWGVPLVRLPRVAGRRPSWRLKRLLDVVIAVAASVVLLPVLLLTAAAVRMETNASVIFRQLRVGDGGRLFTLLKFRSMIPVDEAESQTRWNISTDTRVGSVGRIIRAASLDELPQLLNVLRGDMSLVGPRPERPFFVDRFESEVPGYGARHRIPVGLTGLAAIHGLRGDTSIEERARFDNYYVENWSFWLDLTILLRTARAVVRRSETAVPVPPQRGLSETSAFGVVAASSGGESAEVIRRANVVRRLRQRRRVGSLQGQ
jgi:exopolysaccharide biosynthesis polyprenyl glycosylphosphotransferase